MQKLMRGIPKEFKVLYEEALDRFPYRLRVFAAQEVLAEKDEFRESYSQLFEFDLGSILNLSLFARGAIDISKYNFSTDPVAITGAFHLFVCEKSPFVHRMTDEIVLTCRYHKEEKKWTGSSYLNENLERRWESAVFRARLVKPENI